MLMECRRRAVVQSYPGFRLVADATTQYSACERGVRYGLHIADCDFILLIITTSVEGFVTTKEQQLFATL